MKHRYPLSEVKCLILLQICNVNTKPKFSQITITLFCFRGKSDEHLPETITSLGELSVNPDKVLPDFELLF